MKKWQSGKLLRWLALELAPFTITCQIYGHWQVQQLTNAALNLQQCWVQPWRFMKDFRLSWRLNNCSRPWSRRALANPKNGRHCCYLNDRSHLLMHWKKFTIILYKYGQVQYGIQLLKSMTTNWFQFPEWRMRSVTVGIHMTCFSILTIRVTEDRLMKLPKALWVSSSTRWRHKCKVAHHQNKCAVFLSIKNFKSWASFQRIA